MNESDDALADDARSLIEAYRADESLPAEVRARVWSRVDRSMHPADLPGEAAPAARATRWAVLGLAVAAAAAAIWWGRTLVTGGPAIESPSAASYDREAPRDREAAIDDGAPDDGAPDDAPAPTPRTSPDRSVPAEPPAPAESPAAAEPPAPAESPATSPSPEAAPSAGLVPPSTTLPSPASPSSSKPAPRTSPSHATEIDGLADETELLRAAQSALARGEAKHALALLDAGKRRFGTGILGEEREALHVLALCELGRRGKARAEADAFAAAHPSSPLLSRVHAACADDTP